MDARIQSRYSETETAPVLDTLERAGSGIFLELVTADGGRHDERHSSHDARRVRELQVLASVGTGDFLRPVGAGSICSPWSNEMDNQYLVGRRAAKKGLAQQGLHHRTFHYDDLLEQMTISLPARGLLAGLQNLMFSLRRPIENDPNMIGRVLGLRDKRTVVKALQELVDADVVEIINGGIVHRRSMVELMKSTSIDQGRTALSAEVRAAVFSKNRGLCWYCRCELTLEPRQPNSFTVDHVIAFSQGGSDDIENLVPACRTCNCRKSDKDVYSFVSSQSAAGDVS